MKLGQAIKKRRKKNRITQEELAAKCGLTSSYISQIESGKKKPILDVLEKIAKEIEIPVAFLMLISMDADEIPESKRYALDAISAAMILRIYNEFYI